MYTREGDDHALASGHCVVGSYRRWTASEAEELACEPAHLIALLTLVHSWDNSSDNRVSSSSGIKSWLFGCLTLAQGSTGWLEAEPMARVRWDMP